MYKLLIFISIFVILNQSVQTQNPPCYTEYNGLTFYIAKLNIFPTINADMPSDVLLGYMILDSICHNVNEDTIKQFISNLTLSDTVRYINKFLYEMIDYNPILFLQNLTIKENFKIFPTDVINLINRILKVEKKFDGVIISSSIISHVRVSDTIRIINTSAAWAKTTMVVSCEVIEPIKSSILPDCKNMQQSIKINKDKIEDIGPPPTHAHIPGSCVQFQYALEWERGIDCDPPCEKKKMIDENGEPFIKKNMEYIAFLKTSTVCADSINIYYNLRPSSPASEVYTLYPIINGIVYDPKDEFGFGLNLSAEEFKNKLKERINLIKNF